MIELIRFEYIYQQLPDDFNQIFVWLKIYYFLIMDSHNKLFHILFVYYLIFEDTS